MAHTEAREVRQALKDATFPASKEELIRAAQHSNASADVVTALRAIPAESYANKDEVVQSVRTDPGAELDRTEQAQQARAGGRRGLAKKLRDVQKPPVQEELEERPDPPGS